MLLIEKTGGQIVNSNQSAEDLLGYSRQTFLKKKLWELGILKDRQQFRQTSLKLEEQGIVGFPEHDDSNQAGRVFSRRCIFNG